ncbi:MAG: virulence RhuM family protein [Bacteroidales bacterium]|nr:virulence RhuM family protein [Bacteroidales bacterium]
MPRKNVEHESPRHLERRHHWRAVCRHVCNVFSECELECENNVHFLHVNGVKKPVPFYNLDVIISVGYRVKSKRGTAFRICSVPPARRVGVTQLTPDGAALVWG